MPEKRTGVLGDRGFNRLSDFFARELRPAPHVLEAKAAIGRGDFGCPPTCFQHR
jgi:hypothetical protein